MANITRIIQKRGQDPSALIAGVSKHSAAVHYRNYFNNDVVQLCRDLYGVTIGDVDLKGIVVSTNPDATVSNTVLNGRGNCNIASCEDKTKLDCLMCNHCVVTPKNIPFFLIEIDNINEKIENAAMNEEKEFYLAIKTLNVSYLAKCYEILSQEE